MKLKAVFKILFLVLVQQTLFGQGTAANIPPKPVFTSYYNQGDALWLNDTISYYKGDNDEWTPEKRIIVESRDGLGQELESITQLLDQNDQQWKDVSKSVRAYYYFQDTNFVKHSKSFVKDIVSTRWKLTANSEYDKKGNLIFRENKNWNPELRIFDKGVHEEHSFDSKGKLLGTVISEWDVRESSWKKSKKISYDDRFSSSQLIVINNDRWDEQRNKWMLDSKTVKQSDEFGRLILEEFIVFDESGKKQVAAESLETIYDNEGNILKKIRIQDYGDYRTGTKTMTLYQSDGSIVKEVLFSLEEEDYRWIPQKDVKYDYSISMDMKKIRTRSWDIQSSNWINKKLEIIEIENGLVRDRIHMTWDEHTEDWLNTSRISSLYEGEELLAILARIWSPQNMSWTNEHQQIFSYDESGNLLSELSSNWNDFSLEWLDVQLNEWKYDKHNNIRSFYSRINTVDGWVNKSMQSFGWHMFALTKTESREMYTIEVFPNPTKGVLHVKSMTGTLSRIAILDQFGRLIEAISLDQQSTTIDISHLNAGNYFIECLNGSRKNTFKVIKL